MQGQKANKEEIFGEKGDDYLLGGLIAKKILGGIVAKKLLSHHAPVHQPAPVVHIHHEMGHDFSDADDDDDYKIATAKDDNEMAKKGDDYFFFKHKPVHKPLQDWLCSQQNWRPGCKVCSNCNTPFTHKHGYGKGP